MSLRYPVTIYRRAPGAWVAGRWVDPADGAASQIMATVQPAVLSDYDRLEPLLEGRRVEALVRVYTAEDLACAADTPTTAGDVLLYRGERYVFMARSPWQSNIISHFRYLAARLIPARAAA